jgi:Xaa-Pro dipeptidase
MPGAASHARSGRIPAEPAFPKEEYERRLEAVRAGMLERELDALLLFSPHNVNYLSGMDSENWFDFQALLVPLDDEPTLVILDFELARAENSTVTSRLRVYDADGDPVATTVAAVRELLPRARRLGVEQGQGISVRQYRQLSAGLDCEALDPFGVVERSRLVKSELELEYIRRAAALTDAAVEAAYAAIAAGVPDHDVAAAITGSLYGHGSDTVCWGPVVAAGYRSGAAHSSFCGHRISAGETVFLELTGEVRRYVAPLMRTAVLGEPWDELLVLEAAGRATIETICATARPGVTAGEVALAALAAVRPALERDVVFHFNFGYPIGLGYPPSWLELLGYFLRADNERPLERGMTFHLPISLRKFGSFACNLSHTVVVGDGGAEPILVVRKGAPRGAFSRVLEA